MRQRNTTTFEDQIELLQASIRETQRLVRAYRNYKRFQAYAGEEYREDYLSVSGVLSRVTRQIPTRATPRQNTNDITRAIDYFVRRTGYLPLLPGYILPVGMVDSEMESLLSTIRDLFGDECLEIWDEKSRLSLIWPSYIIKVMRDGECDLWEEFRDKLKTEPPDANDGQSFAANRRKMLNGAFDKVKSSLMHEYGDEIGRRLAEFNEDKIHQAVVSIADKVSQTAYGG